MRFGTARQPKMNTKQLGIPKNGIIVSALWAAWAPCGPQGGSEHHFAPPEAPPGAHFVCSWLQFLDQVVQTLHALLHLFLDGLPILC